MKTTSLYSFMAFMIYVVIASVTFSFRHPWMTETERFMNMGKALKFEKVSYKETRNQYK